MERKETPKFEEKSEQSKMKVVKTPEAIGLK